MIRFAATTPLIVMAAMVVLEAQGRDDVVATQQQLEFHSAFWPNLHNVLWAEAWSRRPATPGQPAVAGAPAEPLPSQAASDERQAWNVAVAYYDEEIADLHPLFDRESTAIRTALLVADAADPGPGLSTDHRRVLLNAAAVYRKYQWRTHDRANREWVSQLLPRLAALSPAVTERLSRLYNEPWFTVPLRVDVVRAGTREGAFTSNTPSPGHVTILSNSAGAQGWAAAEVILHEASHLLFVPTMPVFAAELQRQGKNTRVGPIESWNANVWHPALFYSTGEVVRQQLESQGVTYTPYAYRNGLFERAWPQFRAPIETHWRAFVNGELSRDEAITRIVTDLK